MTPDVYRAVVARDRGCVAPLIGVMTRCSGPREVDHVRAGGMGLRSPSTLDNLVWLCRGHHREKTLDGRRWRPLLLGYLDEYA